MSKQPSLLPIPSELITTLRSARHVAVLTGAGISAESSIPTFREAQTGLWSKFDPEELATPQAFRRNPKLVWDWWDTWRQEIVAQAQPNPGHLALAQLESYLTTHQTRFTLITQNIDGLHHRAGSKNPIELHGNINRIKCFEEDIIINSWPPTGETPPRCPRCGGWLRPDIVWFGEILPQDAWHTAFEAAEQCDLFFSIGTSALVHPAASLPYTALRHGAALVEVNPDTTPLTDEATYVLCGPAGKVLPTLLQALEQ